MHLKTIKEVVTEWSFLQTLGLNLGIFTKYKMHFTKYSFFEVYV